MKMLRRILIVAAAVAAVSQAALAQTGMSRDLVDTALTVQKFNVFLSLVRDADLTFDLKGEGPFTVFAPTDEAFYSRYTKTQLDALRANKPRLRSILLHHVVRGRIDAVTAAKSHMLDPMMGVPIRTEILDGHGLIGGARFVISNVNTSNGILHGIDHVLMP